MGGNFQRKPWSHPLSPLKSVPLTPPPGFTSAAAAAQRLATEALSQRAAVFSREKARQRALYPRIEKIEVSMRGPGLDGTLLVMNGGVSTPQSCARRRWKRDLAVESPEAKCLSCASGELLCVSPQTCQSTTWPTRCWPWWTASRGLSTGPSPTPAHSLCSHLKTLTRRLSTRYFNNTDCLDHEASPAFSFVLDFQGNSI